MTTYDSQSIPKIRSKTRGRSSTRIPGIQLWGHKIILSGDSSIKCSLCDKEESVPDLLGMSSGFREVVYKMHILSKFKDSACSPERGDDDTTDRSAFGPHDQWTTPTKTKKQRYKPYYRFVSVNSDKKLSDKSNHFLRR